jgi:uncharacterized protein YggE
VENNPGRKMAFVPLLAIGAIAGIYMLENKKNKDGTIISVSGNGQSEIPPDLLVLSVSTSQSHPDKNTSVTRAEAVSRQIDEVGSMKFRGVTTKLRLKNVNTRERTIYNRDNRDNIPDTKVWVTDYSYEYTLSDPVSTQAVTSALKAVTDAFVATKASVGNLSRRLSPEASLRASEDALIKATEDALNTARIIARTNRIRKFKVLSVESSSYSSSLFESSDTMMRSARVPKADFPETQVSDLTVTRSVSMKIQGL